MTQTQYIVGVDEVGKGPLAGPVAVCAVMAPKDFDFSVFPHLTDSKKLSEKRRAVIFDLALKLQYEGKIRFAIQYSGPEVIDAYGIQNAIAKAVEGVLYTLGIAPLSAHIMLDGSLKAPDSFANQETIIRGDEKVPIISLASVIAKVSRDRLMVDFSHDHPAYDFSKHKGYGTAAHIAAIKKNGTSPLHRTTFLSGIAEHDKLD